MNKLQNSYQQASAYTAALAQGAQNAGMASTYNALMASPTAMLHAHAAANLRQASINNMNKITRERYMIDGVSMDFDAFVNTLYPEDCAEKTHLILKFKKEE